MDAEKKTYQTPEVIKVEFDASDRITASNCMVQFGDDDPSSVCYN